MTYFTYHLQGKTYIVLQDVIGIDIRQPELERRFKPSQ